MRALYGTALVGSCLSTGINPEKRVSASIASQCPTFSFVLHYTVVPTNLPAQESYGCLQNLYKKCLNQAMDDAKEILAAGGSANEAVEV